MPAERAEHRVGNVPHAGLNRQERLGNHAGGQLSRQKLGDVVADGFGQRADLAEAARFVFQVGFHHSHDLRRVDRDDRRADPVRGLVNRNLLAIRRIGRLVDIVQPQDGRRMVAIQFHNHPLRQVAEGGRGAHSGGQHDSPARRDVGRLHHRHIHRTQEAVARHLRHQRKVQVEEARLPRVDAVAQVGVRLVGRAKLHRLRLRQRAIERRTRRGAGQDTNLELLAGIVRGDRAVGNRHRNRLRRAGRRESAEPDILSVVDQGSSFGCGKNRKGSNHKVSPLRFVIVGLKAEECQQFAAGRERRHASRACTSSRSTGSRAATAPFRRNSSSRPNIVNSFIHCSAWRLRSCARNPLPSSSAR